MHGNDRHCEPTGFVATGTEEKITICAPVTSTSWIPGHNIKVPLVTGEDSKRVMLYVMPILSCWKFKRSLNPRSNPTRDFLLAAQFIVIN